jgi:hypothetical protein
MGRKAERGMGLLPPNCCPQAHRRVTWHTSAQVFNRRPDRRDEVLQALREARELAAG